MKNIILTATLVLGFLLPGVAFAAEKKTDTLKVYGNCEMCKERIEGALKKKDGVLSKKWDVKTKVLTVTYDPAKTSLKKIGEKIAAVGHDNLQAFASDAVYNKLHGCCQYKRPPQSK